MIIAAYILGVAMGGLAGFYFGIEYTLHVYRADE